MDVRLRDLVWRRASQRCEYCRISQDADPLTFHVEHIVAKQHGGETDANNLALACHRCNAYKGPNLTGIDPESGEIVPLFHPRNDDWHRHFVIREGEVHGLTTTGRVTVRLLNMNDTYRVELREERLRESDIS